MRAARRLPVLYGILCVALPSGLMFGSFVPAWFFAQGLALALDIPWDAPVIDQPLGLVWLVLFLAGMYAFMFVGFWLGLLLNAAILRHSLGWSWASIRAAGVIPGWFIPALWGVKETPTDPKGLEPVEDAMYDPALDDPAWS